MPREQITLPLSLFHEDEFCALNTAQQHAFLVLLTRREHGSLGVLPLLVSRYSNGTAGLSKLDFLEAVRALAFRGWVDLDEGYGDVFVRRYLELSGATRNPNRLRAAIAEAREVESPLIREAVAAVLAGIGRLDADAAAVRLAGAAPRRRPSRPKIPDPVRQAVYVRDQWRCVYCARQFAPVERGAPEDQLTNTWLELDHVMPFVHGGLDAVENLRAACSVCNRRRGVDEFDSWSERLSDG